MKKEIQKLLLQIGLTPQESSVYLGLLQSPPLTIASIAKRTGLHRPTIYHLIPCLEQKGLISALIKGKQKKYLAESPQKLQLIAQSVSDQLEDLLPDLNRLFVSKGAQPIIKFLEGKEGIKFIYSDIIQSLKRGEEFYRYSSRKKGEDNNNFKPRNFNKMRDNKQLQRFVITNKLVAAFKKPTMDRAMKVVPPEYDLFQYNITQIIYANKVAYIDLNTETAFLIENTPIAEFQKKIFKLLYNKL